MSQSKKDTTPPPSGAVRAQMATVRSLLEEVERLVPPTSTRGARPGETAVTEQLVEEIARLGCQCIELANALTRVLDAAKTATRVQRKAAAA